VQRKFLNHSPDDKKRGLDHCFGHAKTFFPARQELAVAQTACRASKNALVWPAYDTGLAETVIKVRKGLSECSGGPFDLVNSE
jgi:hypothetical protein